ncbi:DUF2809 domain-containing protein [Glaciibacter sp. 2TAF33]|uniref:ribosomal maturation YjgA family protein n=1 Tax=Glaciibacter sp. 2TAF33 TaxID=3233015 RepID=UPI003F9066CA
MDGAVADFAGDALYAVVVYLLTAIVGVRVRSLVVAAISFALCAAIEVAQLTGVPASLAELFPVSRLILGATTRFAHHMPPQADR